MCGGGKKARAKRMKQRAREEAENAHGNEAVPSSCKQKPSSRKTQKAQSQLGNSSTGVTSSTTNEKTASVKRATSAKPVASMDEGFSLASNQTEASNSIQEPLTKSTIEDLPVESMRSIKLPTTDGLDVPNDEVFAYKKPEKATPASSTPKKTEEQLKSSPLLKKPATSPKSRSTSTKSPKVHKVFPAVKPVPAAKPAPAHTKASTAQKEKEKVSQTPVKPPPASKPKQQAKPLTGLKDGGLSQASRASDLYLPGTDSEQPSILTDPPAKEKEKSTIFGAGGRALPASAIEPSGFCISTGEENEVSKGPRGQAKKPPADDKKSDPKKPSRGPPPPPPPPPTSPAQK